MISYHLRIWLPKTFYASFQRVRNWKGKPDGKAQRFPQRQQVTTERAALRRLLFLHINDEWRAVTMFDEEAILYYADHPVEFVEDIIGATPDEEQAKILRSVAQNQMTSVRSGVKSMVI